MNMHFLPDDGVPAGPIVRRDEIGDTIVSTVRLFEEPEQYETAILGGTSDGYVKATSALAQAIAEHELALEIVRQTG